MADIITGTTTGYVNNTSDQILATASDIRREAADHKADVRQAVYQEGQDLVMAIKDARYDVASKVGDQGDRVVDRLTEHDAKVADRFFDIGRDTQDLRAQVIAQQQQMVAGFLGAAKDAEINALKTQIEMAKQTTYISDKIDGQAEKTRELINDLKYHDLNRGLVERNAALVEYKSDRRHYRDRWLDGRFDQNQAQFAGQWAQLQNQVQAFQSQLQETRQGMVNFGTMAGVGQSSTSNNVR
jgi:hypothetical protein